MVEIQNGHAKCELVCFTDALIFTTAEFVLHASVHSPGWLIASR